MFCSKCGNKLPDDSTVCDKCGNDELTQAQEASESQHTPETQPLIAVDQNPKAHTPFWTKLVKALMIIVLILETLVSLVSSFAAFLHMLHVYDKQEALFKLFPNAKGLDEAFGLVYIILTALSFVMLVLLIGRFKNAPIAVMCTLAITGVVTPIYGFALKGMLPDNMGYYDLPVKVGIIILIVNAVTILLAKFYFDKCKHLYVRGNNRK